MAKVQFKSEAQIIGSMADRIKANTGLNDLNAGSILLILLEAAAQEDYAQYFQMLQILRNMNLDTTTGSDLDNRAFEFGMVRRSALATTGKVTILREEGFEKISTSFYAGFRSRIAGDTELPVNDASEFPATGSIIVGRDTANEEVVTYSIAPVDNTNYWLITLDAPLTNDHALEESVILEQGVDITINSGTVIQVPATGRTEAVNFLTTRNVTILAGEEEVTDVDVQATEPGVKGNISVGAISGTAAFPSPPFSGARATNDSAFSNGRDKETDTKLRARIKSFIQALSQSTKAGISNAIDGLVDPTTAKRVVSSNIILPDNVGLPVKIYIDDSTGFEPDFEDQGSETILDPANGGESRLQLDLFPLVKAQIESGNEEPYDFSVNRTLQYNVGIEAESITLFPSSFQIPEAATAEEVVAAINNTADLLEARTSRVGKKIVITAKRDVNENIQVTGGTANSASILNFPTEERETFYLYKNDKLLSKDGETALIDSGNSAPFDFSISKTLLVVVDGKTVNTQTVTIAPGDFDSPAQAAAAPASKVAEIINSQLAGATASDNNGFVRLVSNTELSSDSKIKLNASTAATELGFSLTEVVGKNADYTLNPELGVIELREPLEEDDKITAGTRNTRAFLTASNPEDYTFAGGEDLDIIIDGGAPQNITFATQTNSPAQTIADEINSQLVGGTAVVREVGVDVFLEIRTNTLGSTGSIEISSGGTANTVFGFDEDLEVINLLAHTAFVTAANGGPYSFVEEQTLVVVLDNDPAGKTFIVTMDYDGEATSGSSTTVFAASLLSSIFLEDDELNDFWVVWKTGPNTTTGTIEEVANPSGDTFRYFYDATPSNFEDFAAGDQASFSSLDETGNNGHFLMDAVNTVNAVLDPVLDKDLDNPVSLTPVLGDRYLIAPTANDTTQASVLDKDTANPVLLTPSVSDKYIIHPDANDTFLDPVQDLLTDSTAATAVHGYRYIIDGTGLNDWVGHDNEIAQYNGVGTPGWLFITPVDLDVVVDLDSGNTYQFDSGLGQWDQNDWGGQAGKVANWGGASWSFIVPLEDEVRSVTDEALFYQYDLATNSWDQNDWGGNANNIAEWDGADWDFEVPTATDTVYVTDEALTYQYDGSDWEEFRFWVEVTNTSGVIENGSTGTGLLGQRRQINNYVNVSGAITVSSAFRATPIATNEFIVLPGTRSNVVEFFSNTKVTSLSARAEIELAQQGAKVQMSSKLNGSDGYIQVTGGKANTILQFSTTEIRGLRAYSYYIGLIKLVHRTIYGDETDLVSFPGTGAAGVKFQILPPTVEEVAISLDITLAEGVSLSNLESEIKSAVTSYINGLGVGAEVILARIVDVVIELEGIVDVEVTSPAENVAIAENELARTKASIISLS